MPGGSMVFLLGVAALIWFCFASSYSTRSLNGTLYINGDSFVATTDEDFICATLDWWPSTKCDYGTCSWGNASLLNLDLNNVLLLNAVRAFSSLKLRLGGTLQDKLRYQTATDDQNPCDPFVENTSAMFGFSDGCLPVSRWDQLNTFFKTTGAKAVFGLNALTGRIIGLDGNCAGAWDSTNAEAFIRYTVNSGYYNSIYGWELGNELSGSGIGARVAADQYASDVMNLQQIVQEMYKGVEEKPVVLGPGGFFKPVWFTEFLAKASSSLQVATHHIYNLGPGVDDHLADKILNPSYLDGGAQTFRDLQSILNKNANLTVAWVGEAGGVYNSGRNHVTNSFVSTFWYVDQLGMSSSYDTKTYCRQSLIGGNYGLLDTFTFAPNPDYYSALLWHKLMGSKVLSASFIGTNKVRTYAHCSKNSTGITIVLINLDKVRTVRVDVSITNWRPSRAQLGSREEYHLSPKNGDVHSKTVVLNGEELTTLSNGVSAISIPSMNPKFVKAWDPLIVAPFSVLFARIPSLHLQACT